MAKFHTLRVRDVRRETDDCVSLAFELPNGLASEYQFLPGQHLTLKTHLDGEEVRRTYSICAAPEDGDLRVAVKKVEGGKFSSFANEILKAGDELDVMTPMGNFTVPMDPTHEKNYVAFAAGSGITPIMALMKTILQSEPKSSFTLFYGNKRTKDVIFLEEIEGLKNRFLGRLSVHYLLSQEYPGADLFYGRIDSKKCASFCNLLLPMDSVDEFFLCGPEEMIQAVRDTLDAQGIDKKKVHFELFTTPGQISKTGQGAAKPRQHSVASKIFVTIDTKTLSFDLESSEDTILEAASRAGADLPFACKGGVCCTCKAKVLEGEVEMDVNYALQPDEVENGYVLTCQSHPKTKVVKVSFDE